MLLLILLLLCVCIETLFLCWQRDADTHKELQFIPETPPYIYRTYIIVVVNKIYENNEMSIDNNYGYA